jgi:hypothetical protein
MAYNSIAILALVDAFVSFILCKIFDVDEEMLSNRSIVTFFVMGIKMVNLWINKKHRLNQSRLFKAVIVSRWNKIKERPFDSRPTH